MNPILRRAGALGASAAFVLAIAGTALAATGLIAPPYKPSIGRLLDWIGRIA